MNKEPHVVAMCATLAISYVLKSEEIPYRAVLNISDLEEDTSDQETRLTAAEENIQGENYF